MLAQANILPYASAFQRKYSDPRVYFPNPILYFFRDRYLKVFSTQMVQNAHQQLDFNKLEEHFPTSLKIAPNSVSCFCWVFLNTT
jgi:hypothetical protein